MLCALVGLSSALYITGLGFYSDDWAFFRHFTESDDRSPAGLFQALYSGDVITRQRPVQDAVLALLFWTFGFSPLGYHVFNAAVLAAIAVVGYLVLRELRQPRSLAVAAASVYILLPHYSTDRFWVAAFQITVSMLLYLVSLYADLRAVRRGAARFRWKALALAALLVSGLAYELVLPLFALNVLIVRHRLRQLHGDDGDRVFRSAAPWLVAPNAVALAGVIAFKAATTVRVGLEESPLHRLVSLYSEAVKLDFGKNILGLPFVIGWIGRNAVDPAVAVVSVLVAAIVFAYVLRLTRGAAPEISPGRAARYVGVGLSVFVLGYLVFIVNTDTWFTMTSLGNRIGLTSAAGIAIVLVGAAAFAAARVPARVGAIGFPLVLAILCGSGTLLVNTLARSWVDAYRTQERIVDQFRADVPTLPHGSAVLLHGTCVEKGGAFVFTGNRDFAGRLAIAYGDPTLRGSTVRTAPMIGERAISVLNFRIPLTFAFREKVFVYDVSQRRLTRLADSASAQRFFATTSFRPQRDCEPTFQWGLERGGVREWLRVFG